MVYDKYKQNSENVIVISINVENARMADIEDYNDKYKVRFPTINNGASIFSSFGGGGTPSAVLVSPNKRYLDFYPTDIQIALQKANVPDPDSLLSLGTISTDLISTGEWYPQLDNVGSTIDTAGGLINNGVVTVKFNVANDQNAQVILNAFFNSSPGKKSVLKIEYKSTTDLWVLQRINKYGNYDTSMHEFDLCATTTWKTRILKLDSTNIFQYPPTEPKDQVPYDISKLIYFHIVPAEARNKTAKIEIKELKLYDTVTTDIEDYTIQENSKTNLPEFYFNNTNVLLNIKKSDRYSLSLYNMNGRCIQILADQFFPKGLHTFPFNEQLLSAGLYLIELKSNNYKVVKKITTAF